MAKKKKKAARKAKIVAKKKQLRSKAKGKKVIRKKKASAARPRAMRRLAPAPKPQLERGVMEAADFEGIVPEGGIGLLQALQNKLTALQSIRQALAARATGTPEDEIELKPALRSINSAISTVQAQIAAEQTPVLAPPSEADVTALANAIRDSENLIAQNAAVNQLVKAGTVLIKTLS